VVLIGGRAGPDTPAATPVQTPVLSVDVVGAGEVA
jgi:hypothetical protein